MQKYFATAESKQIDTTDQGTATYDEDSEEINDVWQPLWGNGVTIRESFANDFVTADIIQCAHENFTGNVTWFVRSMTDGLDSLTWMTRVWTP